MKLNQKSAVFIACALIFNPAFLVAESKTPPASGMSYYQVIKQLGPPSKKQEYQSKHQDIWHYADMRITFKDGEVVRWEDSKRSSADRASARDSVVPEVEVDPLSDKRRKIRRRRRTETPVPLRSILSEVLQVTANSKSESKSSSKGKKGSSKFKSKSSKVKSPIRAKTTPDNQAGRDLPPEMKDFQEMLKSQGIVPGNS